MILNYLTEVITLFELLLLTGSRRQHHSDDSFCIVYGLHFLQEAKQRVLRLLTVFNCDSHIITNSRYSFLLTYCNQYCEANWNQYPIVVCWTHRCSRKQLQRKLIKIVLYGMSWLFSPCSIIFCHECGLRKTTYLNILNKKQ